MTVVKAENVVKDYSLNGIAVHALRGVSLNFEGGEFAAIAGPSGSGKSTFLHLAGCLDTITSGSISIGGSDTARLSKTDLALLRRNSIGFIFQAYNLIPVLSVMENISFPLTLLGVDKKEIRARTEAALLEVGLEGMENRRPKEMSGGQQQRVAIARALVKRPSLILADEPTANLDSKTGREILEIMLKLNQTEGTTFIFSTHDSMVMEFARRIVRIRDGMIESDEVKSA
ncbi:macrolide ABC transporter ATP-binding protein [Spirochaetia bacterium]|nr:macrolide ABC transporter ATP-binding protein [Spirochaetia bacterium]GHV49323.1 macrolide ABC transporter ATP-binding protein [Spirochaetia bacterium]